MQSLRADGREFPMHLSDAVDPPEYVAMASGRQREESRARGVSPGAEDGIHTVRRIRRLGHDTLEAADGPSALAVAEAHPEIELLLTDPVMPNGTSGLVLARRLRERRPDLPVLITSGHSEERWSADVLHEERIAL